MSKLSHIGPKIDIPAELPRYPTLVHMLKAAVSERPDVVAVICEDRQITYAQFGRAVAGLARRVGTAGDKRVALLMANSIEMDVAVLAVMAAGGQAAPVNPFFKERELEKAMPIVDAEILICDPGFREKADELAARYGIREVIPLGQGGETIDAWTNDSSLELTTDGLSADDLALIVFTGGSTGIPKGVDHTHRGLMYGVLQHVAVWPLEWGEERFLTVAPMFHIWG